MLTKKYILVTLCVKSDTKPVPLEQKKFYTWWKRNSIKQLTLKFEGTLNVIQKPTTDHPCLWLIGFTRQKPLPTWTLGKGLRYKGGEYMDGGNVYDYGETTTPITYKQLKQLYNKWDKEALTTYIGLQIGDLIKPDKPISGLSEPRTKILDTVTEALGIM